MRAAAAAVRAQAVWRAPAPLPSRRGRRGAAATPAAATSSDSAPASLELEGLKERTRGSLVQQVNQPFALDPRPAVLTHVPVDVGLGIGAHVRAAMRGLRDAKVRFETHPIPALCRAGLERDNPHCCSLAERRERPADAGGDEGEHGAAPHHRAVGDKGANVWGCALHRVRRRAP